MRYTLPLAAGVAGVTLVAWLALSTPGSRAMATWPDRSCTWRLQPLPPARLAAVNDYLTVHQEFSPSTAMQGVASYVRTVSADESNAR